MKLFLDATATAVVIVAIVIGIAALYAHIFSQFALGVLQTIPRALP